jgi:uncharacterized protein (DUF1697 family)
MDRKLCALLRGVNVNGVKIKMEDLRKSFADLGFACVKTILNTGNVVFISKENIAEDALKATLDGALGRRFGYDAHVLLRGTDEIVGILEAAENILLPDGCHLYVLFCEDNLIPERLAELFKSVPRAPEERLIPHGREAFWIVPKGMTLDSAFGSKVLGSRQYKSLLTSRNVNTVAKIARR